MAYTPSTNVVLVTEGYTPLQTINLPPFTLNELSVTISSQVYEVGAVSVVIEQKIVHYLGAISTSVSVEVYEVGAVSVVIEQKIVHYLGSIGAATIENFGVSSGVYLSLNLIIQVEGKYTLSVPVQQDITEDAFTLSVPIYQQITSDNTLSKTLEITIYSPSDGTEENSAGTLIPAGLVGSSGGLFTVKLILDGIDVSSSLTGQITVDLEESSAAVASFTLNPLEGLIDLTTWVKAPVKIYYITGGAEFLLFNGVVDVPTFDPQSRLTAFTCTDELQLIFEPSTELQIAEVVGGYWSENFFGAADGKWAYARDRLATLPVSMDLDLNGKVVKTPWAAKEAPDYTLNEAVIFDGSLKVEIANSRSILNKVELQSNYTYSSFKERTVRYRWGQAPGGVQASALYGIKPVILQMVLVAAQGSGWPFVKKPSFTQFPKSGYYNGVYYFNRDINMVVETDFTIGLRHTQAITDAVALSLVSRKSVESLGELKSVENVSMTAEYSKVAEGFEDKEFVNAAHEVNVDPVDGSVVTGIGNISDVFYTKETVNYQYEAYANDFPVKEVVGPDIVYDLSEEKISDATNSYSSMLETAKHFYKTEILASHRGNIVGAVTILQPTMDRTHTVKIDTSGVVAQGKVRQIVHSIDIDAGSATSQVYVAISRSTAVGIVDEDTPLESPEPEELLPEEVPDSNNLVINYGGVTRLGNWIEKQNGSRTGANAYGMQAYLDKTEFLVPLPEILAESVSESVIDSAEEISVDVPDETLTLNA
ncbi:MAG: hypothetical protein DRR06_06035 [Gammaproteobacteria bacterium]|nr:MAG: hypothetical protein DRR06_06035 [Gammaproteobacteria bacterium]